MVLTATVLILGLLALIGYVYPFLTLGLCAIGGVLSIGMSSRYRQGRMLWDIQYFDYMRLDNLVVEYIGMWEGYNPGVSTPFALQRVEALRTLGFSGFDQVILLLQHHLNQDGKQASDSWRGRFDAAIALYNQHAEHWNDFLHMPSNQWLRTIKPAWCQAPYL